MVLPDPKLPERNLRFLPTVTSEDDAVARENAALLALLHLMPSLPLERKVERGGRQAEREGEREGAASSSSGHHHHAGGREARV